MGSHNPSKAGSTTLTVILPYPINIILIGDLKMAKKTIEKFTVWKKKKKKGKITVIKKTTFWEKRTKKNG